MTDALNPSTPADFGRRILLTDPIQDANSAATRVRRSQVIVQYDNPWAPTVFTPVKTVLQTRDPTQDNNPTPIRESHPSCSRESNATPCAGLDMPPGAPFESSSSDIDQKKAPRLPRWSFFSGKRSPSPPPPDNQQFFNAADAAELLNLIQVSIEDRTKVHEIRFRLKKVRELAHAPLSEWDTHHDAIAEHVAKLLWDELEKLEGEQYRIMKNMIIKEIGDCYKSLHKALQKDESRGRAIQFFHLLMDEFTKTRRPWLYTGQNIQAG